MRVLLLSLMRIFYSALGTSTANVEISGTSPSLPSPTVTEPLLMQFTLNFTILNLQYEEVMDHPGSWKFNTTESILQGLLRHLFQNTSVEPLYSHCRLTLLRPKRNQEATGVDAICTLHPGLAGRRLDRERLYWELSHLTHGVTRLGPYTLDKDSLFVNGFTHRSFVPITSTPEISTTDIRTSMIPSFFPSPTTTEALLLPFTLNFTILNLHYEAVMDRPGSWKFNSTERALRHLLRPLFNSTSVGHCYSGCRLTSLRPEKDQAATGVDAICTLRPYAAGSILDREQLYWELSQLTHGVTEMGPYTLDKDSLYVNGFTHRSSPHVTIGPGTSTANIPTTRTPSALPGSTATEALLLPFTLNFTILNLHYEAVKDCPGSWKFNSTERVLQHLLRPLFNSTSVGHRYSGCRLTSLRPEKDQAATGVDAICTLHPHPAGGVLDREQLYWELSQLTHGVTELGPYTLDKDSLYVNGFTHRESPPHIIIVPSTSTANILTSGTPSALPGSTATVALLLPFTLNFTILNLRYKAVMDRPGSWKFNSTERVLQHLLRPLFNSTSVGPRYYGCRLTSLRPEKNQAATGVDAICTLRPHPAGGVLDREQLYWELSQLTHGITELGPYTLDKDSLYVNGFTHRESPLHIIVSPSTSTANIPTSGTPSAIPGSTATEALLLPFTLNFTILNLRYEAVMDHPGSWKFNSTNRALQHLLRPLFNNTSVGPRYSGCRLTLLRPEKHQAATGVDAICTIRQHPVGSILNREHLYRELSQLTHGVTELGPYTLDKDSLYVNGFTHRESPPHVTIIPSTSTANIPTSGTPSALPGSTGFTSHNSLHFTSTTSFALVPFTINFTITNLHYVPDMRHRGSAIFKTTGENLQLMLASLFRNTSIGPLYSGCRLISLRPEKDKSATRVDAICTLHPDSAGHRLNREQLYWELSQLTHSVTELGPYTLDKDSLNINGYTHRVLTSTPSIVMGYTMSPATSGTSVPVPTAAGSLLMTFTLNFTILNLHYNEDLDRPGSWRFNTTEGVMQNLLKSLFQNTSIGPLYSSCRLTSLRPKKNGEAIGVNTICNLRPDLIGHGLDREKLYGELSQLTHGVTRIGPFNLDKDSLYVNGYTHQTLTAIPRTTQTPLVHFTVNFTITSLHFRKDMQLPGSPRFNNLEKSLQILLDLLFQKTSIGPLYSGCRLTLLRPEKNGSATGVDTICTLHRDPTGHGLDREILYQELSQLTYSVTQLGPRTLDQDSLYVNGYTQKMKTTTSSTTGPGLLVAFTINFTITNVKYTNDMGHRDSLQFNKTERVLQTMLTSLFNQTSEASVYAGCRLASLRPAKGGAATRVDAICTFHSHPAGPELYRELLYWELSQLTYNISHLGPFQLDRNSLYVNGYTYAAPISTDGELSKEPFMLNLTINNLHYSAEMGHLGSHTFNIMDTLMQHLLHPLFQKSSLGARYVGCKVTSLRPLKKGSHTQVDLFCTYWQPHGAPVLLAKRVFHELSEQTYGITQLGPYSLDKDSLYVNGYNERGPDKPPTTHVPVTTFQPSPGDTTGQKIPILSEYQLIFRIINWNLSHPGANSSGSATLKRDIQDKVTALYAGSQLRDMFHTCLITNLTLNPMWVTVKALFSSNLDPHLVEQVFLNKTLNGSSHWLGTTYQLADLHVTEMEIPLDSPTGQPIISSSPQHFQLNFTITNLLYSQDIVQPNAGKHQQNKRSIEDALNQLFHNSSIKSNFSDCQVLAFRPIPHSNHTGVDSLCHLSPFTQRPDRVTIYKEFLQMTQDGTRLQNFTLDKNSIFVDGYSPNGDPSTENSGLPFWAIILIALAGLMICLLAGYLIIICLRKKNKGDYEVERRHLRYYLSHLNLRKQH
ncbi:mucin-16 [Nycticebus coucang]|uniref:mucin-16 n=1 Tax=Nycticebus coucang TaxID=9470 RepID=UPI00234D8CF3|nr:mucin-16 [Nycticebus coucang]